MPAPVLVLIGGLPATGKSTIAAELVRDPAVFSYFRIDSIEQALRDSGEIGPSGVQASGYVVGYAVAGDLLAAGNNVLVECVNPLEITRSAWRNVARACRAALLEVELFCGDPVLHRERVETRVVDISGLKLPGWNAVQAREYEPWGSADLRIDTTATSPAAAAQQIRQAMADRT